MTVASQFYIHYSILLQFGIGIRNSLAWMEKLYVCMQAIALFGIFVAWINVYIDFSTNCNFICIKHQFSSFFSPSLPIELIFIQWKFYDAPATHDTFRGINVTNYSWSIENCKTIIFPINGMLFTSFHFKSESGSTIEKLIDIIYLKSIYYYFVFNVFSCIVLVI